MSSNHRQIEALRRKSISALKRQILPIPSLSIYTLLLTIGLLCSTNTFAGDYRYVGSDIGWAGADMQSSTGGYYEWYGPVSGNVWFDIYSQSPWTLYRETVYSHFNNTDVDINAGIQASANISIDPAPANSYYIIVWKPNTPFNSGSVPAICAATTKPDDVTMQTIYMRSNDAGWFSANAKTAIYYFGSGNTGWTDTGWSDYMTQNSCINTVYEAQIPALYSNIILVRLNPAGGINWDSKWNQTSDLVVPSTPNPHYVIDNIDGGYLNNAQGHWSTFSCSTTIYLSPNVWDVANATERYAIYYWNGGDNHWIDMTQICSSGVYTADIPGGYTDFILCRMNGTTSVNDWSSCWNQTADQTTTGHENQCFTVTQQQNNQSATGSWAAYTPTLYTITFNANGGTGSMASIESICPNGSETLPANSFTRSGYNFDMWNTAADGTGVPYVDGFTVTGINSNITLYAQWEDDCDVVFAGAAGGTDAAPTFTASVGAVTLYHNSTSNSTAHYTYLSSDGYILLTAQGGASFNTGDKVKAVVYNQSSGTIYTTGFRIGDNAYTESIGPRAYKTIEHELLASEIVDGKVKILRGIPNNGYGCFVSIKVLHCTPSNIVNIPGTVNKGNVAAYSADMTWYGANDEYFNLGPTDALNTGRWMEWTVNLTASDVYTISEIYSCPNGHYISLDLLEGNTIVATYDGEAHGSGTDGTDITYNNTWDLTGVTPGIYTLRARNEYEWSRPKVKSLTFTGTFTPGMITVTALKETDAVSYLGGAWGTITDTSISSYTDIPLGTTITDNGDNTITINTTTPITITAPLTAGGTLHDIPGNTEDLSCTWRFSHWENVPATGVTTSVTIRAVYFPTFAIEYETNGGTINDAEYAHWYRYTGDENDITPLPSDVTKDGFEFAGWYQVTTTRLFMWLTNNYYGDYRNEWCLRAHWILPCDEPQIISKVTLTGSGSSSYTYEGYNNNEYAGVPVVNVGGTTAVYDIDSDGNDKTGYQLSATNQIVFATLRKGDFRIGDQIRITITAVNTSRSVSSTTNIMTLYYGTGASDAQLLVNLMAVNAPGIYTYTLDADDVIEMQAASANGVGVFREAENGEDLYVYSVEIFGCRDLIFDDNNGTGIWSDAANWAPTYHEIPSYYQATRIIRPCTVDIANAHALNIKLCKQNGNNGSLTINANAALEVAQIVSEVHGTDYVTTYPVAAADILIKSNASNQGAFAHGDSIGNTHATVQFYARGVNAPASTATWQYMGTPFSDVAHAVDHYENSWMCRWNEDETGNAGSNWQWVTNDDPLSPFAGYCLSQNGVKTFTNTGTLVPSVNRTLTLTCNGTDYKGWNMFANSWMAPINIAQFEVADFGTGAQATIYLFNTGVNDGNQTSFPNAAGTAGSAGQYVAVPIATASSMLAANRYIAPMQAFFILTEAATNVTLNYNQLVRNPEHGTLSVLPNRAPKRDIQDTPSMPRIIVDVEGTRFSDRLYLFENSLCTDSFDNAWDGYKFEGEPYTPQLMTRTGNLDLSVDVSPSFAGKQIAFRAGEDEEYTLRFSTTEYGLHLRDLLTGALIEIADGNEYTFRTTDKQTEVRFIIEDNRLPAIPTATTEPVQTDEVLAYDIYSADGRLLLHHIGNITPPLALPNGVYIVRLQTRNGIQTKKITF